MYIGYRKAQRFLVAIMHFCRDLEQLHVTGYRRLKPQTASSVVIFQDAQASQLRYLLRCLFDNCLFRLVNVDLGDPLRFFLVLARAAGYTRERARERSASARSHQERHQEAHLSSVASCEASIFGAKKWPFRLAMRSSSTLREPFTVCAWTRQALRVSSQRLACQCTRPDVTHSTQSRSRARYGCCRAARPYVLSPAACRDTSS